MSKFELKEGSGSLFINNKKADTHPDMKGSIKINGKEVRISAWKKVSKNGNDWLSIAVDKWEPKGSTGDPTKHELQGTVGNNEDLPF